MKLKKWIEKEKILILVCMLLAILLGYLAFDSYEMYKINRANYKADNLDAITQRTDSLFLEINNFPQDEGNDILYLNDMNSLNKFINAEEKDKKSLKEYLESDFFVFMDAKPIYYQLRYINEFGMEIIRINQDDEGIYIIEEDNLQNKKTMPYFQNTMKLDKEDVYVSPLNLNIERGIIENRGTEENPEYIPVIRYSTPVFDDLNEKKGIIILNVYANYFLEDVRRLDREGEISFLIDNNGYYLAHPNRSKEFSFMFDGKNSISSDYSNVGDKIINSFEKRYAEDEDHIFTFKYLHPTIGTFEIYQGSKKILGENPEEEYYWVLVTVSDKDSLNTGLSNMKSDFVIFILISTLIIIIVIILLILILALNGSLDKDK
jgi:methyl-accepting chemotaxis protein